MVKMVTCHNDVSIKMSMMSQLKCHNDVN